MKEIGRYSSTCRDGLVATSSCVVRINTSPNALLNNAFSRCFVKAFSFFVAKNSLKTTLHGLFCFGSMCISQSYAVATTSKHVSNHTNTSEVIAEKRVSGALSCKADDAETNSASMQMARLQEARSVDEHLINSCIISNADAERRIRSGNMLLIDIRSPGEFHDYRVPESINLQPHVIKTKKYLQSEHLLIIGGKADLVEMALLCRDLKAQGFERVNFVNNGFEKWQNTIIGEKAKSIHDWELSEVNPREFTSLKSKLKWLILDITGEDIKSGESRYIYEDLDVVPFNDLNAESLNKVKRFGVKNSNNILSGILVVSKNGEEYARYSQYLKSIGIDNLYFLKGGKTGYIEYQSTRQAFLSRLNAGPVKPRNCSGA